MAVVSRFESGPRRPVPGLREWTIGKRDPLVLFVPASHRLAGRSGCSVTELIDENWILSPDTALGRLTLALCHVAGFEPKLAALVDNMSTGLSFVTVDWGVTIAPELAPVTPDASVARVRLLDVKAARHRVLIVRDGEQRSPAIASAIAAVQALTLPD
jgi:LysR family transcriptional regulator, transcription activator of glutamate synthase operon